jgi:uncharacterized membrane protein YdjX (TVP38/TMEM64 family)
MKHKLGRLLLIVLLLVGSLLAWHYRHYLEAQTLQEGLHRLGGSAPVLFIALYVLATVLFLPGSVLSLAGGALFGPWLGTLYNLTGATLGAALAFVIARYLAADWVTRRSGGRLKQLIQGVEREGWRFVAFTRLVPLFPFNALNYALGLTRIRLGPYVLTSLICMFPGGFAYTYLGYVFREAVFGVTGDENLLESKALLFNIAIAVGLIIAVLYLPRFVKRLRQKNHSDTEPVTREPD